MSLKHLLNTVLEEMSDFIQHILPSTKHLLDAAIHIVNVLNKIVVSEASELLTMIIPGDLDNKIRAKLIDRLPQILVGLKLAKDELDKSPDEIILEGIKTIQSMEPDIKAVTLQSIFQLVGNTITDDSVKLSDLQKIGQSFYEHTKQ